MGDFSSRGIPVRRERLIWWSWIAWLLLAIFIIAGSAGHWAPYAPGIWAPTLISARDIARNVALYVPFGIFGMLALRRHDLRGVVRVTLIAILFSFMNEALQLYTVDRVASLTDIVSAAVGTVSGAAIVALWASPR